MLMNKKIILFDWDDTLFSKTEYKNYLRNNLARICETTKDEIFDFEEKYFDSLSRSDNFKINDFVNSFAQKFNKKIDLKDFSTDNLKIYSKALFPETIEVLNKIKNKYSLGIYSQGFVSLQKLKIKNSGVESFFDENFIFIDRNKTEINFLNKLPVGVIIVDDKKEVIETIKSNRPDLKLIWINRKDAEKMDGVKTIKNLRELENLI